MISTEGRGRHGESDSTLSAAPSTVSSVSKGITVYESAHRHLHEEIPNVSSSSDAYVSVSDEHKAEAILFLVFGRPKALSQRSDPKRRIHPYKKEIERGKYTEVEAETE